MQLDLVQTQHYYYYQLQSIAQYANTYVCLSERNCDWIFSIGLSSVSLDDANLICILNANHDQAAWTSTKEEFRI